MPGGKARYTENQRTKEKKTNKKKPHTNHGVPRHRDGKARYMENRRTKKKNRQKKKNNRQITGYRDTGMARPDTQKIGGLKKKRTNHGGPRHRDGKARYTENWRTKKKKKKRRREKEKKKKKRRKERNGYGH